MQAAGFILRYDMMVKIFMRPASSMWARKHIKYVGIVDKTWNAYKRELKRFLKDLEEQRIKIPKTFQQLDYAVSEYINRRWLQEGSHGYCAALVSALGRFYPACRSHLASSRQYLKNWERTLARRRALPVPSDVLMAMAGAAYAFGRPRLAATLLLGFACLLRTTEVSGLLVKDLVFLGKDAKLMLNLTATKKSMRTGVP